MGVKYDLPSDVALPPGTQRIENTQGTKIVLSPVPSRDPNQPLNWPTWRKTVHMALLSVYATLMFSGLMVSTPLWVNINNETGVTFTDLNNSFAIQGASMSLACVFFIPFANKFGRRSVYISTALIMSGAMIWQARARNAGDFIGSNFVAGLAAAVNEALFQITVSDLFFVHQRASVNGLYLFAVSCGNNLSPVASGYIVGTQGWRWPFYYMAIFSGLTAVVMIFALEESKFPAPTVGGQVITSRTVHNEAIVTNSLREKDVKISTTLGELNVAEGVSRTNSDEGTVPMLPYWQRLTFFRLDQQSPGARQHSFLVHVLQPFKILFQFPAVAFAALQYGWLVSAACAVSVTQAVIYPAPPYNFGPAAIGLMYLPFLIGTTLGSIFGGPLVDFLVVQVAKKRKGIHEPETRLWLFVVPGGLHVAGVLLYGLTIAKGMAWPINAFGAGLMGFALTGCADMAMTYLQDSYQYILGDALVAVVFVRNVVSTILIFAIPPWMKGMSTYNMFVVIAVLSALVALTYVPLLVWGRTWRIRLAAKYQKYADLQY